MDENAKKSLEVEGSTVEEVKASTEAKLIISPDLRQFDLAAA